MKNFGIGILALLLLGQITTTSCVPDPDGGLDCTYPSLVNLDSIKQVFYSPYHDHRFARETDTVRFEDFGITAEFGFQNINQTKNPYERVYPGACASVFNVQNVSNIELYLTSPFGTLSTGTEVSYLFLTDDGTALNRFRNFRRMNQYMNLKLKERPSQASQINTRLVVYFRDGTSKSLSSNSPVIR